MLGHTQMVACHTMLACLLHFVFSIFTPCYVHLSFCDGSSQGSIKSLYFRSGEDGREDEHAVTQGHGAEYE